MSAIEHTQPSPCPIAVHFPLAILHTDCVLSQLGISRSAPAAMLIIQIVFALLFGLALGSFLNVCISRLPRHRSIVQPPSHCPSCRAPIGVRDNIPLLSFALLRGRCRNCRKPIGWRYPFVEAAVAILTIGNILFFGFNFWGVASAIFCALLLALAISDAETMTLPDALTLPLLGLGILYRAGDGYWGELYRGRAYALHSAWLLGLRGTISAVATVVALLLLRWLYAVVRRRQGLGLGDVKLAAGIAAWLGARQMCVVFFIAVVTGALTALIALAFRRRRIAPSEGPLAVPFGTFLALSGIYCVFIGLTTVDWYLRFFR
jgi:leader peptidase (prepilin peptidase) / N-methyltransferase